MILYDNDGMDERTPNELIYLKDTSIRELRNLRIYILSSLI